MAGEEPHGGEDPLLGSGGGASPGRHQPGLELLGAADPRWAEGFGLLS